MLTDTLWQEITRLSAQLAQERAERQAADAAQQVELDALNAKPNLFSEAERTAIDRLVNWDHLIVRGLALAAGPLAAFVVGAILHRYHAFGFF